MRTVALLPMRQGSERIRGKNTRVLAGRPLYRHVLDSLLACASIAEVLIDTDSDQILDETADVPRVRTTVRPEHLRAGEVAMNDVLLHDLDLIDADLVLQTHSTNPFLRSATVTRAIEQFAEGAADSLFTVTPLRKRFWWPDGTPINHDPRVLRRTQDLPPVYEENSSLYLFRPDVLRRTGNRIGDRPILLEMEPLEAWDIDEEADWRIAELLAPTMLEVR